MLLSNEEWTAKSAPNQNYTCCWPVEKKELFELIFDFRFHELFTPLSIRDMEVNERKKIE